MCCASHAVADAPTCCQREPNEPVDLAELGRIGVLYFELPKEERIAHIDKIAKERDYKNRDELTISRDKLPNYEEKIKIFFNEYGAAGPMNPALLRLLAHVGRCVGTWRAGRTARTGTSTRTRRSAASWTAAATLTSVTKTTAGSASKSARAT